MAVGIKSIGHAFAVVAQDIVKFAHKLEAAAVKVQAAAPVVEALTSMIDPRAAAIERAAFYLFGKVTDAVHTAGDAASANGLNLSLDATEVAEIKELIGYLKNSSGLKALLAASNPPVTS
jgi:hypothetical protein